MDNLPVDLADQSGRLILVKHSLPEINPGIPARKWLLSEEGRRRCRLLARRLAHYQPVRVACSLEPKARETADLLAQAFGLAAQPVEGLHEHERSAADFLTPSSFRAAVARLFAEPDRLAYGDETGNQAAERFTRALAPLLAAQLSGSLVVVAHGTVISLFLERTCGVNGFEVWSRLGLPSFAVLSLPGLALVDIMEQVTG